MSTHKHIDLICIAVTIVTLLITALFMNGEKLGIEKVIDEDLEVYEKTEYFTANDQNGTWSEKGATKITLGGDKAKVRGRGAYAYQGSVVIKNAGYYVIEGTLSDGSVIVDTYRSSKVWIRFNGAHISCSDDAALIVEQAEKVFVTLAGGSDNSIISGASISQDAAAAGRDGAVFARDDLTINGSGALTVNGGYKHGIVANDDLVICGSTLTVTAVKDALRTNDSLRIRDAKITVRAGDDGLTADSEDGYIYIESGIFDLDCEDKVLKSPGLITVAGGTFTVNGEEETFSVYRP